MLIKALRGMRYSTRMMRAGDVFEVRPSLGRVLVALGRAIPYEAKIKPKRDPLDHDGDGRKGGSVSSVDPDIAALRIAYHHKFGKRPFNGWAADKLREKLAEEPAADAEE